MKTPKLYAITRPVDPDTSPEQAIAWMARVSSPNQRREEEIRLLRFLVREGHWSPFDMVSMVVEIETSRAIMAQMLRHWSLKFQEFCVSGDTMITQVSKGGKNKISIKEYYEKFMDKNRWGKSHQQVRIYDQDTKELTLAKVKEVFSTGIKECHELTLQDGRKIKSTEDHKFLTKEGFKRLKEIKEGDFVATVFLNTIEWSYVKSIDYVGPMETYDMEIEHKDHNYVANGIITHNSQRYSEIPEELDWSHVEMRGKAKGGNRQGSEGADYQRGLRAQTACERSEEYYRELLSVGIAPESARMVLPLATPTRAYVQGSVRSWITFFWQRMDNHAQKEMRELAEGIFRIFEKEFPCCADLVSRYKPCVIERDPATPATPAAQ